MLKMIRFYTEADQGEGTGGGGGGGIFFMPNCSQEGKIIFQVAALSYLRDWFSSPPVT